MKIITIIGARPQIIKAAALSRAIRNGFSSKIKEVIVHTGQHYDENMSEQFFSELNIPKPDYNLNVGSGSHGKMTALMTKGIEEILLKEKPQAVVLYGDTNSTLAGAIAASKIHIPVVHIEAGLRSFNKKMPEEVNRILCDHVSTLLFSPTKTGVDNLQKEGFSLGNSAPYSNDNPKIYHSGDVMYDNSLHFAEVAEKEFLKYEKFGLKKDNFILATIHRDNNTDDPIRLSAIFKALNDISKENDLIVFLPVHPRTKAKMKENLSDDLRKEIENNSKFVLTDPVSFLEIISLEKNCRMITTDSGGLQKEAFFFNKPCVILRPQTEWVEIVEAGAAILADADEKRIKDACKILLAKKFAELPPLYGDGKAAEFICGEMLKWLA
jgi:UDP-GlcNAc3NAcA epimerase